MSAGTGTAGGTPHFLLRFTLLSSLMGISVGLAQITTTLFALHLGAQGWLLGLVAAAPSIGILFVSLPMGLWVERFGPAPLFIGASALVGLLYALLPLLPGIALLVLVSTVIGFLMPARFVSLNTVFLAELVRLGPARAGWFRGTHMAGMYLVGPLLAATLVEQAGFRGSYWLIATLFFVTVALAPSVLAGRRADAALNPAGAARPSMVDALRALLADAQARRLSLQEGLIQTLHAYYTFYIVVIAVSGLGLPATRAGLLVAIEGSTFVATLFLLGGPVTRLGPRAVGVGAALAALAAALLALAQQVPALWAGAALLGLGLGIIQTRTVAQFATLATRLGRGRVAGLNALFGPGGGLVGGLLGGTLGAWLGLQAVFLLFAAGFAALAWRTRDGAAGP